MLIQNRFLNGLFFTTIAEFLFLTAKPPGFICNLHQDLLKNTKKYKKKKNQPLTARRDLQLFQPLISIDWSSRGSKKETEAKKPPGK